MNVTTHSDNGVVTLNLEPIAGDLVIESAPCDGVSDAEQAALFLIEHIDHLSVKGTQIIIMSEYDNLKRVNMGWAKEIVFNGKTKITASSSHWVIKDKEPGACRPEPRKNYTPWKLSALKLDRDCNESSYERELFWTENMEYQVKEVRHPLDGINGFVVLERGKPLEVDLKGVRELYLFDQLSEAIDKAEYLFADAELKKAEAMVARLGGVDISPR